MEEKEIEDWKLKWEKKFQKVDPPWHLKGVNKSLERNPKYFEDNQGKSVFVPLCGKSVDMIYFAKRNIDVIGVELSELSVQLFFEENNFKYTKEISDSYIKYTREKTENEGCITIYCGDLFKLDINQVDYIYDRASLYALGPELRYVSIF